MVKEIKLNVTNEYYEDILFVLDDYDNYIELKTRIDNFFYMIEEILLKNEFLDDKEIEIWANEYKEDNISLILLLDHIEDGNVLYTNITTLIKSMLNNIEQHLLKEEGYEQLSNILKFKTKYNNIIKTHKYD